MLYQLSYSGGNLKLVQTVSVQPHHRTAGGPKALYRMPLPPPPRQPRGDYECAALPTELFRPAVNCRSAAPPGSIAASAAAGMTRRLS
ncbi:hypothetical protein XFF6970_90004 [Xanthomonas citri pv. fuscans]|nr:hypothetical protein XFF6970_90004 [Xanthomonas citri pv. fuscans]